MENDKSEYMNIRVKRSTVELLKKCVKRKGESYDDIIRRWIPKRLRDQLE